MAVDRNLFLYDLAVVAIMKNEAPYVKEWLDYHLAAGVDHFFILDNESPDNLKEVLQPYIDAGIVTYKFYPGTGRQVEAYIEAYKAYRFFCRYIAFLDADEFIFPQENKSIVEVADELFSIKPNIGGLQICWMMYGSNNLETADYSKGVLERFTRRAENVVQEVKSVTNPRRIKYMTTPHYATFFVGVEHFFDNLKKGEHAVTDKIRVNHYQLKSRAEFANKNNNFRGDVAYGSKGYYASKRFTHELNNDVFDDSILAYRDACAQNGGRQIDYSRLIEALFKNLEPILNKNATPEFLEGKLENFLTCRALASKFKEKILGEELGAILEQAALDAIFCTIVSISIQFYEVELLLDELPNLLPLKYPVVTEIRRGCVEILPQIMNLLQSKIDTHKKLAYWRDYNDFDNLYRLLKALD